MPSVFETIAAQHNGRVVRTKVNPQALMAAAREPGVVMAADGNGSFIWPDFQPVVDGMMTVARLLQYTVTQDTRLSQATAAVPPFFVSQGEVSCPWEAKGTVMRLLNEQYKDRLGEQIDGVKIHLGSHEWVLVLPDADQPLFHIHAEARSYDQAQDLVAKYERIVEGLQE
jgi:mannose-1-phosphate guanylyltransferase/phosphomannomutase